MAIDLGIGINQDAAPERQPERTYRYGLNAVTDSVSGDRDYIMSEPANQHCFDLPEGYLPVGDIYIGNDRTLVFSTNGERSEIGLHKEKCRYKTLVNSGCLGFDIDHRIDATYRLRRGCDDVIYFTDGLNPVRVINITNLRSYWTEEYADFLAGGGNPDAFGGEKWECALFDHSRSFIIPCIEEANVAAGGSLEIGTYQIAIQLLDQNRNATPFIYASQPVTVYPEDRNLGQQEALGGWHKILGGISQAGDPLVGQGPTNKLIRYNISNIDTRFAFYRVAVMAINGGTGNVAEVSYTEPIVISGSDALFVLDSLSGLSTGALEEVRQIRADIRVAKHITQLENMLILSYTKDKKRDFCALQEEANKIQILPTSASALRPMYDNSFSDNVKNPENLFEAQGYMADEVYAFGIVYVYSDGAESPVFHIPGKASQTSDFELLTVVDAFPFGLNPNQVSYYDVKHLGFTQSNYNSHAIKYLDADGIEQEAVGQVPRFMVFNTGSSSTMGYHQSNLVRYPMDRDCDGNLIWGSLAGTPIRHHRFPNRNMIPISGDLDDIGTGVTWFRSIGIIVNAVGYPDPDIVGHYIVRSERAGNETIIDKGMLLPNTNENEGDGVIRVGQLQSQFSINTATDYVGEVITPKTLYNNINLNEGEYLSSEGIYNIVDIIGSSDGVHTYVHGGLVPSEFTNIHYSNPRKMVIRGEQPPFGNYTATVRNNSYNNETDIVFPLSPIVNDWSVINDGNVSNRSAYYVAIKVNRDVYSDLAGLTYIRTHNCMLTGPSIVYGGDVFVQPLDLMTIHRLHRDVPIADWRTRLRYNMFVESDINIALRAHGEEPCERVIDFPWYDTDVPYSVRVRDYVLNKYTAGGQNPFDDHDPLLICPEYYKLNPDFSRQNDVNIYFPLPRFYDCCSECEGDYPHRYWYSLQSFQEEAFDNYFVFLPNNYRDISGEHGEITNIFTKGENLYIHCREMLWIQPKNLQERVTDEFVTFIGTGDLFAIPPRPVSTVGKGAAGSQDKWATIDTPHGLIFVDQLDSKIYLLGEGINPISDDGLLRWAKNNLNDYLNTYLEGIGVDKKFNTYIHSVYDPIHRRAIITKLDYEPIDLVVYDGLNEDGSFVWWNDGFYRVANGGVLFEVELGDPEYFVNKSWTLSYSFLTGKWVSWHSYLPSYYFNNKGRFYSNSGSSFWSHDSLTEFNKFYGEDAKHIIEIAYRDMPIKPQVWDSVLFQSMGRTYNNGWIDDKYRTFDTIMLYNNYETTGEQEMVVKAEESPTIDFLLHGIRNQAGELNITRRGRLFHVNGFRNIVDNYGGSLFSDRWEDIRDEFPIDKVVNPAVIDVNKDWKDLNPMREDFIVIRLSGSATDVQIRTKYLIMNKSSK